MWENETQVIGIMTLMPEGRDKEYRKWVERKHYLLNFYSIIRNLVIIPWILSEILKIIK